MLIDAKRAAAIAAIVVVMVGCSDYAPVSDSSTTANSPLANNTSTENVAANATNEDTTVKRAVPDDPGDDDSKSWTLGDDYSFGGWASGDNRVDKPVHIWAILNTERDYADGEIVAEVHLPDGSKSESLPLKANKLESPGDPNYGITWTPTVSGRHKLQFHIKTETDDEYLATGVHFDVK